MTHSLEGLDVIQPLRSHRGGCKDFVARTSSPHLDIVDDPELRIRTEVCRKQSQQAAITMESKPRELRLLTVSERKCIQRNQSR
jgi:hypothetical protein